jgi:uncharacterized protein YdeI (YjbR/CyaY-like superfamily)
MASKPLKTTEASSREQWREWLAAHHDSESEVWLIFHKRHTGRPCIEYGDALDEALCFGWIDSLVRRLDDDRYARKFTPRKPDSAWSEINRKRYAELQAAGRLAPSGVARGPGDRIATPPPRYPRDVLPAYIVAGLREHPEAWSFFETLSPSHQRAYVGWIDSAKQEATRQRRLEEAIRRLMAGERLGLK